MSKKLSISLALLLICFIFPQLTDAAVGSNWIEKNGITWTFDKNISTNGATGTYQYGTFVNGDYWVVNPQSGGVVIIKITPEWDGQKHGSVINPTPHYQQQGYYVYNDDVKYNSNFTANILEKMPIKLNSNQSLVSTIGKDLINITSSDRSMLKTAQVLTCLASVPPADALRPPYVGNEKPIFRYSDLRLGVLPNLNPGFNIDSLMQEYNTKFSSGVMLDHVYGPFSQKLHPEEYMIDYNPQQGWTAPSMLVMINGTSNSSLFKGFIQFGIDEYYVLKNYQKNTYLHEIWDANGGHDGGRKWPILFAAVLLNNSEMKNMFSATGDYANSVGYGPGNLPSDYINFGEDDQLFYVRKNPLDDGTDASKRSIIASGKDQSYDIFVSNPDADKSNCVGNLDCLAGYRRNHVGTMDLSDKNNDIYGHGNFAGGGSYNEYFEYLFKDRGLPEFGINHIAGQLEKDGLTWDSSYRWINSPHWSAFALSALILEDSASTKTLWNNNVFFDYVDRWVEVEPSDNNRHGEDLTKYMWNKYRDVYGCKWTRDDNTLCSESDVNNPNSSCYSNGHYDCDGVSGSDSVPVRCSWQATIVGSLVTQCSNYPNQRACSYDPCNLGCNGVCGTPTPTTFSHGDIDKSGTITLTDATMAASAAIGITTLTTDEQHLADVSNDGHVTAYDAALILQWVAGIISIFPAGNII